MIGSILSRLTEDKCSWKTTSVATGLIDACECGNHIGQPDSRISQD